MLGYFGYVLSITALITGAGVGLALARHVGASYRAGATAAVITVLACLVGHVSGTYADLTRNAHVPFALVRSRIGVGDVLRHGTSPVTWLFIGLGGFYAFGTGAGRPFGRR